MANQKIHEESVFVNICRGDIDYEGIVKNINEGVVIIREGKIIFANDGFCEISQRVLDEVINADFGTFIAPLDRERVSRYLTEYIFTEHLSDRMEFTLPRTHDDALIDMKVSVVECGGAPAILATIDDITERRKTRIELERLKGRFESIILSMNEVVVSLSPHDYTVLSINPAAEVLYGVPLRDFTSGRRHIMDFVHPDDQEVMERFHQDLPKAEFDEAQYRIISGSKQVKWVRHQGYVVYSDQGTIRRMDHVIRDITEEKKVLEALTRSEARYREFFESTNDMAYVVRPDGVLIDLNNAGLKLLGFESKKEAFSSNLSEFYVDISEQAELLAEINEEGHVEGKRVKLKNRAGEVIEVAVTARAKTDDSGYLLYYDGIATNITKALEDQSNRVLRNAAGGLCHYLNSHLMQLDNSEELTADDMKSLDRLIEKLVQGENTQEIAIQMKEVMKSMHYFHKGIRSAYKRISEVTKAFNKAFQYTEESYVTSTILDIFKTYGYDPEDPAR